MTTYADSYPELTMTAMRRRIRALRFRVTNLYNAMAMAKREGDQPTWDHLFKQAEVVEETLNDLVLTLELRVAERAERRRG